MTTLAEAREKLLGKERWAGGGTCPCCGQFAKVYKRQINSTMARSLISLASHQNRVGVGEWMHIPTLLRLSRSLGDAAKLALWGLIEPKADAIRDDGSNRAGIYRVTTSGFRFVMNEIAVPKYLLIYNSGVLGTEGPSITIRDALGSRFSYDELMAASTTPPAVRTP